MEERSASCDTAFTRSAPDQHRTQDGGRSEGAPLIAAQDLSVRFGDRIVLDHIDFEIRPGEIVTLVGLNGSGKSTLARVIVGLVKPSAGQVRRAPGLRVGYMPQWIPRDTTLPLTVTRFIALGGRFAKDEIATKLDILDVGHLAGAQIATLSGGEIRRVLLARALLRKPQLLVLDEPMSGVDVTGQAELYRLIADIRRRTGCGILLISHDLHLVMAETDTVICLNHHVCCAGRPHAVVRDPRFVALFGQEVADTLAVYRHEHDHVHDPRGAVVTAPDGRGPHHPLPDQGDAHG